APHTVQEMADVTYLAFDLADRYRTPVMVLADGMLGQTMEPVRFGHMPEPRPPEKPWALTGEPGRPRNTVFSLVLKPENLRGLTAVFADLHLVRDEGGKPVINADSGVLAEVLSRIDNRTSYGETASGRYLADEFAKEPCGWEFDVVRLLVVALLRAGKIEATSKGQSIESALSLEARSTFTNNNLFRQASFRPKVGLEFPQIIDAAEHYKEVFGKEILELEQGVVANAIREAIQDCDEELHEVHTLLVQHSLPGTEVLRTALDSMRSVRMGREEQTIQIFNGAYKELKEAIKRGSELAQILTGPALQGLDRARHVLADLWPVLNKEEDLSEEYRERAAQLKDLMAKETFFRELPSIDQHTHAIVTEYERRHREAAEERVCAYRAALEKLRGTPGWEQLSEEQQSLVSAPLDSRTDLDGALSLQIPLLRAETDACPGALSKAIEEMLRIIDGNRLVRISASGYFSGGIENEEQLEQALSGLKDECLELIGAGKKVLIQ
ncbi:MAG: hypothetical protein ACOCVR_02050, partial [Myxococcota bacterium]